MPEAADARWIVLDGRRWRATDPAIPPALKQELVDELMAARRAVGAAKRAGDTAAEADARGRVHDAKVALGERGEPWWDQTADGRRARVRAAMKALTTKRGPGKTICPSDAARAVGGSNWRPAVAVAREVARELAAAHEVRVLQRGDDVDLSAQWHGPVRISTAERP